MTSLLRLRGPTRLTLAMFTRTVTETTRRGSFVHKYLLFLSIHIHTPCLHLSYSYTSKKATKHDGYQPV